MSREKKGQGEIEPGEGRMRGTEKETSGTGQGRDLHLKNVKES